MPVHFHVSKIVRMLNIFRRFLLLFSWSILSAECAWAYVDPGSGMLMIQSIIALCVGIIAFLRSPWQSILALINRIRRKDNA